ncbi:MAG: SCO1664 family protein [Dehalococcoidia bacterium]|nr:SCO1664 family protein [Dehalococcoidia bacterium]
MSDNGLDFAAAERLLLESEFLDYRQVWSSNYVYLAQLCSPQGQPFAAIYKPRRGEMPLWDFPGGTLYKREVAAYRLAKLLGWPFVPPTVVREGPEGVGSLQVFVEHDHASHYFEQRAVPGLVPQLKRMLLFDYVANNADRKGGHCLLDGEGRIWGIDHGLCFHEQYKLRTVMWDWAEEPVPGEWLDEVRAARKALTDGDGDDEDVAELRKLLDAAEWAALLRRMDAIVRDGVFPKPGPHRPYPWPLV